MTGGTCAHPALATALAPLGDWVQRITELTVCDARFNTFCFLFLFAPLTILAYWAMPHRRAKLAWLTVMSFVFYSFWDWRFSILILLSAFVDFFVAQRLEAASEPKVRKRWLLTSLIFNLGLLAFFKYTIFALANFQSLFDLLDISIRLPSPNLVLPVGISFYTFQTLSYTIDVYRGHVGATRDFLKYLTFVSMFPQLVAGPIVRYRAISEQLDNIPLRPRWTFLSTGLTMFTIGLFKKVVLADSFANWIAPYWTETATISAGDAWLFIMGYMLQIYFDFSGYSDMAIGLGAMLGLRFPINFRGPYSAVNPGDLWRRWHITLMSFIRDYVYIPLGGNRVSAPRMAMNTYIIFVLVGLWHQASWTMILFGVYQASCILLHRFTSPWWDRSPIAFQKGLTIMLWLLGGPMFAGIDFRAAGGFIGAANLDFTVASVGLGAMTNLYAAMFGLHGAGLGMPPWHVVLIIGGVLFTMVWKVSSVEMSLRFTWPRAIAVAAMLMVSVVVVGANNSPFLYYQF